MCSSDLEERDALRRGGRPRVQPPQVGRRARVDRPRPVGRPVERRIVDDHRHAVGGQTHVGMEEFAMAAGLSLNHIPFKGGADALTAVIGGHVDALADSSSWAPHVESGKLRLLATWGEERTPRFKSTPTLKDLGYNVVVDRNNTLLWYSAQTMDLTAEILTQLDQRLPNVDVPVPATR